MEIKFDHIFNTLTFVKAQDGLVTLWVSNENGSNQVAYLLPSEASKLQDFLSNK